MYTEINTKPLIWKTTVWFNNFDSPRKMLAVSSPMSEELRCRSQRAVGRRNDTQRISTASLALAQPHTSRSSQWNRPKPLGKSRSHQLTKQPQYFVCFKLHSFNAHSLALQSNLVGPEIKSVRVLRLYHDNCFQRVLNILTDWEQNNIFQGWTLCAIISFELSVGTFIFPVKQNEPRQHQTYLFLLQLLHRWVFCLGLNQHFVSCSLMPSAQKWFPLQSKHRSIDNEVYSVYITWQTIAKTYQASLQKAYRLEQGRANYGPLSF